MDDLCWLERPKREKRQKEKKNNNNKTANYKPYPNHGQLCNGISNITSQRVQKERDTSNDDMLPSPEE